MIQCSAEAGLCAVVAAANVAPSSPPRARSGNTGSIVSGMVGSVARGIADDIIGGAEKVVLADRSRSRRTHPGRDLACVVCVGVPHVCEYFHSIHSTYDSYTQKSKRPTPTHMRVAWSASVMVGRFSLAGRHRLRP